MTTILRKYHSVARCTLLGEMIEDTLHRYYYRPHVGGELTFADKESPAMTLTLVVVGLVLAPPTGWLLAAWLADLT